MSAASVVLFCTGCNRGFAKLSPGNITIMGSATMGNNSISCSHHPSATPERISEVIWSRREQQRQAAEAAARRRAAEAAQARKERQELEARQAEAERARAQLELETQKRQEEEVARAREAEEERLRAERVEAARVQGILDGYAEVLADTPEGGRKIVVGKADAGKSTLVNGACGLGRKDPGRAPTSCFGECTSKVAKYPLAPRPGAAPAPPAWLFDSQGGGTTAHPAASYAEDKHLVAFDELVLCYHQRLHSIDDNILAYAAKHGLRVSVVHTKTDIVVAGIIATEGDGDGDDEAGGGLSPEAAYARLVDEATAHVQERLAQLGVEVARTPIFFVNSLTLAGPAHAQLFDEAKLLDHLAAQA